MFKMTEFKGMNHGQPFDFVAPVVASLADLVLAVQEGKVKRCPLPDDSMVRIPRAELDRLLGVTCVTNESLNH